MKRAIKFLQNIYLWDTTVSLYHVLKILWKKIVTFDIDQRAASVSYSFLLAVFPGVIFLFTLIPFVPIENLDGLIMNFLRDAMPRGIYENTSNTIQDIVSRRRSDVLSFGFFFTVFAATNGMMALMRAFNMALQVREKRSYLKARLIALFLTVLLIVVLISAIVVLIVGTIVLDFLFDKGILNEDFNFYLLQIIRYGGIFLIFFLGICVIYYFAPAVHKRLRFFNFGAFIASILGILVTNLFSFYLANFNSYNKLYGSIGTLIALMVWIYLVALILILGFEINISVRDALLFHGSKKEKNTPENS
ncbi:ribonuclease BN [Emticicia oligotrophica DSM 17448]|uniref:Ribonuclease BN n=1 Tax=Emticicia oligotrophica (strain DSM 17448 / CIP 109782 / MTCC 6937 / GPTSA100-15) TaxID=929562 RepID=A0ABM5N399_EMTOG|nr:MULTISPECIES: YihY/virulence factor BrkB family protein [Emticicia]AFK03829.1 ribonuclease BN [Emticicia oligotrophica DSM 17448]